MPASTPKDEGPERRMHRLEAQLDAVTKELESFTYAVSHDLRAPLRGISGYVQVLQEELGPSLDAQHQHYLTRIQDSALKLSQLIDGLLELSRVGRTEMQMREVDVSQLTQAVLQDLIKERSRAPRVDVQPGMRVHADSRAMQAILHQLLHNAVKVSTARDEPHITVTQRTEDGFAIVCVADNGVGFEPRYADKLFAPFQRLHADPSLSGKGIGLALVQRLVARHGGRVWADAKPDGGAKFYLSLPTST